MQQVRYTTEYSAKHTDDHPSGRLIQQPALTVVALAGFLLAIFGTYWDDAWHTVKGRDSFLVPPHIALYAGITLTAGALTLWLWRVARAEGWREAIRLPGPCLVGLGVIITFLAAPIDNAWHEAFGRDAVIWSPPHMLGVAGSLLIAAGLLLELASTAATTRWAPIAAAVASAAVVAVAAVPVLEYETDVPQFDIAFYLPVLAGGVAFALGLVRLALRVPYPATTAAAVYTAVMFLVFAILAGAGMPAPLLPALVLPALALDLTARHGVVVASAVFVGALYAVYVPYLNWVRSDVFLDWSDILVGVPLALLTVAAALAVTSHRARTSARRAGAVVSLVVASQLLAPPPPPAGAHDPGQGMELAQVPVSVEGDGSRARIEVALPERDICSELTPVGVVARRAGEEISGDLREFGPCRYAGEVVLPERGRWFVYAQFSHDGERVETWLPITAGEVDSEAADDRSLYSPPSVTSPPSKTLAGIVAYGLLAAVVVGIPALYRRQLPRRDA
jgi:hypothetical protein